MSRNAKRPLIFVHGNWGDETVWAGVAQAFIDRGHPVVCLRMPGRGDPHVGRCSATDYADVVAKAAVEQKRKYGIPPVIFGHSLGATTSLIASSKVPVAGLVLTAPNPPANMRQPRQTLAMILLWLPWFLEAILRRTFQFPYKPPLCCARVLFRGWSKEAIANIHLRMHADSGRIAHEFMVRSNAVQVNREAISCPTLCIAGSRDEVSTPAVVRLLAKWCPRGQYLEIPGSHFLIMESEARAQLVRAAVEFMDSFDLIAPEFISVSAAC